VNEVCEMMSFFTSFFTRSEDEATQVSVERPPLRELGAWASAVHPLSIILTCRRISEEATLLLFAKYSFTLRLMSLHHRTHILSPPLLSAITTSSLCVTQIGTDICIPSAGEISSVITSSMLLFPDFSSLTIHVKIDFRELKREEQKEKDAIPRWFKRCLRGILEGLREEEEKWGLNLHGCTAMLTQETGKKSAGGIEV
jgi:hypothetical protein